MYADMTAYFKRFGWDESKIKTVPLSGRKPKLQGPAVPRLGQQSHDDWIKPFNEEDLNGWDGAKGLWRVAGGTIIGETTKERPLEHHSYLIWRDGAVEDFELRLKFRISRRQGNSGVQYRSRDLGDREKR